MLIDKILIKHYDDYLDSQMNFHKILLIHIFKHFGVSYNSLEQNKKHV